MAYKLPNPDKERTERNRELKKLRSRTDPGRERAERAAELALAFHEERDINHVMELAQLVLGDVDDGPALLLSTYLEGVEGTEDRMERLAMLANVGRWIEDDGVERTARDEGRDAAARWVAQVGDEIERAERLSLVERRFDAALREAVQAQL